MPSQVVILTGAPVSESLDWTPSSLLDHFVDPIARFVRLNGGSTGRAPPLLDSNYAAWRLLRLRRKRLRTGFSQQPDLGLADSFHEDTDFFTTADVSFQRGEPAPSPSDGDQEESILSQFCERSLAAQDEIPSSQLDAISSQETSSFVTNDTSSFISNTTEGSSAGAGEQRPQPPICGGVAHLTDLEDIPNASYLASIEPQTMTVNMIVGIISILPERSIRTRWGATRSLVEVLVGDETRAGFAVTFWLPPASGSNSDSSSSSNPLAGLRPQDVILIRNVALGSFMRKVYGHGLRRDLTKVHLLHRRKLDAEDVGGHYSTSDLLSTKAAHPQLLKASRVREWVVKFVGSGTLAPSRGKRKRGGRSWDLPPPSDTQ